MKTNSLFACFVAVLIFFCASARAQTSGYSGTGANIDVVYHRAEWRINPDSQVYEMDAYCKKTWPKNTISSIHERS